LGLRWVACALVALAAAAPAPGQTPGSVEAAVAYLEGRQQADGAFAEPGRAPDPSLTSWAVLGLAAAGRPPAASGDYLSGKPHPSATDLELRILALAALARDVSSFADRLEELRRTDGAIGPTLNSTIWGVLALEAAGRPAGNETVRFVLRRQARGGGWSWSADAGPDSNDTAAAVQALRATGVGVAANPIRRALSYLRTLQNADGGFELTEGRGSDTQSTSWAVQAFLAAGRKPGSAAYAYLERMRRADGSFRYSARYAVTPVWVTAQALAALAGRPFPLS
jgi:prenyltransferase/squalene oxidase-like repeat protein